MWASERRHDAKEPGKEAHDGGSYTARSRAHPEFNQKGAERYQIFFNSCPRYSGTRYLDQFGWYVSCVACGYAAYPLTKQRGRPGSHMPDEADPPRRARRISFSSLRLV